MIERERLNIVENFVFRERDKPCRNGDLNLMLEIDWAWSSLDKGESLSCQITSPFNKKIGRFCVEAIF